MLDLDDYETEYLSKKEQRIRGPQAVYSANLMGLSNLKPLEYILFEHNVFCKYTHVLNIQPMYFTMIQETSYLLRGCGFDSRRSQELFY